MSFIGMEKGLSYIDVGGGVCLECEVITVPGGTWLGHAPCATQCPAVPFLNCALSAGVKSKAAAVVFHPWAWLGGCMWDPVVSTLTK